MALKLDIDLPFAAESVVQVLGWGARPETAPFTHWHIAAWCDRFWLEYMDVDAPPEIERLLPLLAEIDMEWDMRSLHESTTDEHGALVEDEQLPAAWFEEWLRVARSES